MLSGNLKPRFRCQAGTEPEHKKREGGGGGGGGRGGRRVCQERSKGQGETRSERSGRTAESSDEALVKFSDEALVKFSDEALVKFSVMKDQVSLATRQSTRLDDTAPRSILSPRRWRSSRQE